ncbi:SDR family NAD(P)-dependent oxidoreductase [Halobaculum sp. MBLA0147]|uniref:SDR family NAD(P)-dependent oxidoreductase n=1 Tax=Halobaculum sp. MBLA0147 TaxID=3079934 RepID=UPI0035260A4F
MTQRPEAAAGVADADLDGTTALVTGSTSGIGREAALALGRLGAEVLVHGRDEAAGEAVVTELEGLGADARFLPADFADVGAVRTLADVVSSHVDELDVLANNAGGYFREGRLTDLGVEYTFHVNHLAGYQLTADLLPVLADDARVVTTSSAAHRGDQIDLDAVESVDDYSSFGAYQRSKLANVQFTAELGRRFEAASGTRTANCLHPGAIPGSGFFRSLPGPLPRLVKSLGRLPFVTSPADGAATLVYLAVADRVADTTGRYFADCAPETPADVARDPEAQRRLWERSADLLGIDEPLAQAVATDADADPARAD